MTESSKKLLITTSTFPRHNDDHLPRFVFDLGGALCTHFEQVHVLAPGAAGAMNREHSSGMDIHRYTYMYPRRLQILAYGSGMIQNMKAHLWAWLIVPLFIACQAREILRICREERITIVNSHWMVFQGVTAAIVRKRGGFRHVMHVHAGGLFAVRRLPSGLGRWLARYIAARTDHIICESNFIKASLDNLLGYDSDASISCMGVDTELFSPQQGGSPRTNAILFIGRLVKKKGVPDLLKAMSLLLKNVPDATLDIVGSGPLESDLKARAQDVGLPADKVHFFGRQVHADIVQRIASSAVVVVPSIVDDRGETEGMPTVILEALAMGKQVVASDVAGASDVLSHKRNGRLCNPGDPIDLAAKLQFALQDKNPDITQQALKTGQYYSWPNLGRRYAEMLVHGSTQPGRP